MSSTPLPTTARSRWLAFVLGLGCAGLILYGTITFHILYFSLGSLLLIWLMAHVCLRSSKLDVLGLLLLLSGIFGVNLGLYMVDTNSIHERKSNVFEIIEAIKQYDIVHQSLPQYAVMDPQGKPLLSWRVMLLPYLGMKELHQAFRLNEPWNSEHNIKLLPRIPKVYRPVEKLEYDHETDRHLIKTRTRPGFTHIVALRGPGSVFDCEPPVKSDKIKKDVLLIGEAGELIPWTKPENVTITPGSPPPWLKAYQSGRGFTVLGYFDGNVVNCYENENESAFLSDSKQLLERMACQPK